MGRLASVLATSFGIGRRHVSTALKDAAGVARRYYCFVRRTRPLHAMTQLYARKKKSELDLDQFFNLNEVMELWVLIEDSSNGL